MKRVSPLRCAAAGSRALSRFVLREEPEADGNLRAVEELARERDHAVHEVGLDEGAADFALADWLEDMLPLARTKPAMPLGREVVDEVLDPGEVGVALHGGTPSRRQRTSSFLAEPVRVVEGRVGEDVVGAQVGVEVARKLSAFSGPRSASMPRMARFMIASFRVVALIPARRC
jgi:hypothetical protein